MVTRGKTDRPWPETLLAYAAGIVDADGCLQLHIARTLPSTQRRLTIRYQPELIVTNTYRPLIELLVANFGGVVWHRKKVKEHHKLTYRWRLNDVKACEFARLIEPYMVVKREQAQILVDFYDGKIKGWVETSLKGWGRTLKPEEIVRRDLLYARMRMLNDDRRPQRLNEGASLLEEAMRQSELHGNMQSQAEMT